MNERIEKIGKGLTRKTMALLLAVCMICTLSPPIMAAGVGAGVSGVQDSEERKPILLSGFAPLPGEVREQSVPIGTSSAELNLPDTLEATLYSVSEDTEPIAPTEPLPDDGVTTSAAVTVEGTTTPAAVTIEGVTWESDPAYDGETEGEYLFTAVLPEGYAVEGGAALPTIAVTVGEAEQPPVDKVIAMIDALPSMDEWTAMEETAARAVMNDILTAKAAYDALTAEEKATIDEARTKKLIELAELAQQLAGIMPMTSATGLALVFKADAPQSGDGYVWNKDTLTLTLTDLNYTSTNGTGIQVPDGATLVLNGVNSLTVTGGMGIDSNSAHLGNDGVICGSYGDPYNTATLGALTIEGSGTLAVTCASGELYSSWGMRATSITMNGGSVTCTADKAQEGFGVLAEGNIIINGGSLSGVGLENLGYGTGSTGVCTESGSITVNSGATLSGTGNIGVVANNLTVDGGTVNAVGEGDEAQNLGVRTNNNLTMNSGTLNATADGNTSLSAGVGVVGTLIVNGGTLNATAADSTFMSAAVMAMTLTTGADIGVKCNIGSNTGYADATNFAMDTDMGMGFVYEGATQTTIAKDVKIYKALPPPTVDVAHSRVFANGAELIIIAGSDNEACTNILYDKDGDGTIGDTEYLKVGNEDPTAAGYWWSSMNVYGGSGSSDYVGDTKITIRGGKVSAIYGGGYASAVTGNTSVTMSGGSAQLYGGGEGTVDKSANVTGNTSVIVTSGIMDSCYGGGRYGDVDGDITVHISGNTFTSPPVQHVWGGSGNGKVTGDVTVTVDGDGFVGQLYGGSYLYAVSGSVTIKLSDCNVLGPVSTSDGSAVGAGSSITVGGNVSIGDGGIQIAGSPYNVTSFAISPALTGADGSVYVKPMDVSNLEEGAVIATGAVASDAAKIKLTGWGTANWEAYFDSNDNTIRVRTASKTDISGKLTVTIGDWGYGDTAKAPATTASGGITIDPNELSYTYSGTANDGSTLTGSITPPTAAGSYTVTVNYEDDTQQGSKAANFTIAKAPLTITGGTVTARGYSAGDKTATVTAVTFGGLKNSETLAITTDYTVSGAAFADANVGTNKPVTATVALTSSTTAANYTLPSGTLAAAGNITQVTDGTTNPDYSAALTELNTVHIITNVTPTLADVTLPAGWSFTGDKTARLAGNNANSGKQSFAVLYTSQNHNYPDVTIAAQPFPVSTVAVTMSKLKVVIIDAIGGTENLSATVTVTGAALSGDLALTGMEWRSSCPEIASISNASMSGTASVTATGVAKGVSMVGVAYKNSGDMLGYVLVKVIDNRDDSANTIGQIKDITDTLGKLVDKDNPTEGDKGAVNAVADEVTKLPEAAKEALTKEDVESLDDLKKSVNGTLTITIDETPEGTAPPAPTGVTAVGTAIACGVDTGAVTYYVTPTAPTSTDIKMELKLDMEVDSAKGKQLQAPLFFTMTLPSGVDTSKLTIKHIKDGGAVEAVSFTHSGQAVSFKLSSFSGLQFVVESGGTTDPTPPPTDDDDDDDDDDNHGGGGGGSSYDEYTITATAHEGGEISPSGRVKVDKYSDKTFTITSDEGWVLEKVLIDGNREVTLTNGKYTFKNVTEPYTIDAYFVKLDVPVIPNTEDKTIPVTGGTDGTTPGKAPELSGNDTGGGTTPGKAPESGGNDAGGVTAPDTETGSETGGTTASEEGAEKDTPAVAQPEDTEQTEPEDSTDTGNRPFVVLSALFALAGLAFAAITVLKKKSRKRKIISIVAAIGAVAVFLFTTGWSGFAAASWWTLLVAALAAVAAWGVFGKYSNEEAEASIK